MSPAAVNPDAKDPAPPAAAARTTCAVALGSNLGNRAAHLERAVARLGEHPRVRVLAVSPWIETAPVGGPPGQGAYLNGALLLETDLGPDELLGLLLEIEAAQGRERRTGERGEPRTLDLDLLLYGDRELSSERLCVPHPRMEERAFVLEPLSRIAPDLVLPRSRMRVRERLEELRALEASDAGGNTP